MVTAEAQEGGEDRHKGQMWRIHRLTVPDNSDTLRNTDAMQTFAAKLMFP